MVLATSRVGVIEDNRKTMAWTLRQLHVSLYHGFEYQLLEVTFHLVVYLVGQPETAVIHRQQESFDFQSWIQFALDNLNGVEQFADALQSEVLTLYWDDHRVGCRQGIDGDETQRG